MAEREQKSSIEDGTSGAQEPNAFVTSPGGPRLAIDLALIAKPIGNENPSGDFLRYEGTYDRIEEARKEDDASLPVGVWERKVKKADWNRVRQVCLEALNSRSKDLQIAMWLAEAQIHLLGFEGIASALEVICKLCETFWDDLHPRPQDLDLDVRLAPLYWFNEKVALQLKFVAITSPEGADLPSYTYADWESANLYENLASRDPGAARQGQKTDKPSRSKFLSSVTATSFVFYRDQYKHLVRSMELLASLERTLANCCGAEAPSLRQFGSILDSIFVQVKKYMEQKKEVLEKNGGLADETASGLKDSEHYDPAGSEVQFVSLSIRSRAQAYRMLDEAADYLMIHEPHSPAPYLIKRAVSWGNMSLTELLLELVHDNNDLKLIFNLLGIKGKPGN